MTIKAILFGMSTTRTDKDIVEEVLDTLDSLCPNTWDALIWRREEIFTRFAVYAPLEAQAAIDEDDLGLIHVTPNNIVKMMADSRNEWVEPNLKATKSPFDEAVRVVDEWLDDMMSSDNLGELDQPDDPVEKRISMSAKRTARAGARRLTSGGSDTGSDVDDDDSDYDGDFDDDDLDDDTFEEEFGDDPDDMDDDDDLSVTNSSARLSRPAMSSVPDTDPAIESESSSSVKMEDPGPGVSVIRTNANESILKQFNIDSANMVDHDGNPIIFNTFKVIGNKGSL